MTKNYLGHGQNYPAFYLPAGLTHESEAMPWGYRSLLSTLAVSFILQGGQRKYIVWLYMVLFVEHVYQLAAFPTNSPLSLGLCAHLFDSSQPGPVGQCRMWLEGQLHLWIIHPSRWVGVYHAKRPSPSKIIVRNHAHDTFYPTRCNFHREFMSPEAVWNLYAN